MGKNRKRSGDTRLSEETNFEKLQRKAKENDTNWLIEFLKDEKTTIIKVEMDDIKDESK